MHRHARLLDQLARGLAAERWAGGPDPATAARRALARVSAAERAAFDAALACVLPVLALDDGAGVGAAAAAGWYDRLLLGWLAGGRPSGAEIVRDLVGDPAASYPPGDRSDVPPGDPDRGTRAPAREPAPLPDPDRATFSPAPGPGSGDPEEIAEADREAVRAANRRRFGGCVVVPLGGV